MADVELFEEKDEEQSEDKRPRSPSFPYLDLDTSVQHALKLFEAGKMSEIRLTDAARTWGMTPKSGSLLRYISALAQFGLVETSGSGEARKIKISGAGRRILQDNRPGVREKLLAEASLKPKLISGLYLGSEGFPEWGRDRPADNIAESALMFDLNFGKEAARRFIGVYDATIKHAEIDPDEKSEIDIEEPEALETETPSLDRVLEAASKNALVSLATSTKSPFPEESGNLNVINFKSAGDGLISISATLDAEGLDVLEKKIAAFKLLLS